MVSKACNDVEIEPSLVKLTGEEFPRSTNIQDEVRLDIDVRSFWERGQRAFFDVSLQYLVIISLFSLRFNLVSNNAMAATVESRSCC